MMKQQHILTQIPDYALGLLPQSERQQVERHTVTCADCRHALRREIALGPMIRGTLSIAAQPPAHLRAFMPAIPKPGLWQRLSFSLAWQRQLAPIALLLILLLGGVGLYLSDQRGVWKNPPPTFLAATVTMTKSPTSTNSPTITQTKTGETVEIRQTAVSTAPSQPQIAATPAPNPTPIAALPVRMASN